MLIGSKVRSIVIGGATATVAGGATADDFFIFGLSGSGGSNPTTADAGDAGDVTAGAGGVDGGAGGGTTGKDGVAVDGGTTGLIAVCSSSISSNKSLSIKSSSNNVFFFSIWVSITSSFSSFSLLLSKHRKK